MPVACRGFTGSGSERKETQNEEDRGKDIR